MSQLTRRDFLLCTVSLAPCLAACAGTTDPTPSEANDAVQILTDSIRIDLSLTPQLTRDGGSLVISDAHVIVVQSAPNEYRAFTNVCTHAGCGIWIFERSRMLCQCHGSEFGVDGGNLKGPATQPLARFEIARDDSRFLVIVLR